MKDLVEQVDSKNAEKKSIEEEIDKLRKRLANAQVGDIRVLCCIVLIIVLLGKGTRAVG